MEWPISRAAPPPYPAPTVRPQEFSGQNRSLLKNDGVDIYNLSGMLEIKKDLH